MNIAFCLDSLRIGGAELLCLRLGKQFAADGHRVRVIGLGADGPLRPLLEEAKIDGSALDRPSGLSPALVAGLAQRFGKMGADVVISNHFRQLIHVLPAALICNTPHIHIEHDTLIYQDADRYLHLLRLALLRLHCLVTIAPSVDRWFRHQLPACRHKIHLIPNGVDTNHFSPHPLGRKEAKHECKIPPHNFIMGTCARFAPIKNLSLMLEVFHAFQEKHPNTNLLLVGDGPLRSQLQCQAAKLGLEPKVIFAGMQTDPLPWLRAMDLYLLTSDDEGLPLSILEAMACGTPIVSRKVGELPGLLDSSFSRILDTTSPDQWRIAIEPIFQDRALRVQMASSARSHSLNYEFHNTVAAYYNILDNIG